MEDRLEANPDPNSRRDKVKRERENKRKKRRRRRRKEKRRQRDNGKKESRISLLAAGTNEHRLISVCHLLNVNLLLLPKFIVALASTVFLSPLSRSESLSVFLPILCEDEPLAPVTLDITAASVLPVLAHKPCMRPLQQAAQQALPRAPGPVGSSEDLP